MVLERDATLADGTLDTEVAPLPYLGRSVRIVGDWRSVDASETPHEKNKRGELGKGPYNWYFNRTSLDPLGRTATANSAADRRNTIEHVIAHAPQGKVNPERLAVTDAKAMSAHIKRVAKHLGASDVGIMRVSPSFLYSEGRYPDDGTGVAGQSQDAVTAEETARRYPYAIVLVYAWDYEMGRAHRHRIGDAAQPCLQRRRARAGHVSAERTADRRRARRRGEIAVGDRGWWHPIRTSLRYRRRRCGRRDA